MSGLKSHLSQAQASTQLFPAHISMTHFLLWARLKSITQHHRYLLPWWIFAQICPIFATRLAIAADALTTRDVGSMPGVNQTDVSLWGHRVFIKLSSVYGLQAKQTRCLCSLPFRACYICYICSHMQSIIIFGSRDRKGGTGAMSILVMSAHLHHPCSCISSLPTCLPHPVILE